MKKVLTLAITAVLTTIMHISCLAAGWQQNTIGYWYENENGTWPANTWEWIDGNKDGRAECYYFNENGYMLSNTITPDGYQVNADGAWIENGIVQIRLVSTTSVNSSETISVSNTTSDSSYTATISDTSTDHSTKSYAKKVWEIVNQERKAEGKSSLEWDETLSACASKRAKELVETFSHSRPDRTSCFTIYRDYNVSYHAAGENIAMGQTSPEKVMNSWMNSAGHKANILSDNFGKIGVGCYYSNGYYYWVQMFTD